MKPHFNSFHPHSQSKMVRSFLLIIFYLLILITYSHSYHFLGGTITWQYISSNTTDVTIELKQTYSWTNSIHPCLAVTGPLSDNLTCLLGCNSSVTGISVKGNCISFDLGLNISKSQTMMNMSYPLGAERVLAYQSFNWIPLALGAGGWSIATYINLNIRNDTGQINSSPFSSMSSLMTLPVNISQTIRIPMVDSDGDIVRCRWPRNNTNIGSKMIDECADVCQTIPNAQLSSTKTLDNNCSLTFTPTRIGYYVIAIQLEDFIPSKPNSSALSSTPLQFIIRSVALSCPILPNIIGEFIDGTTVQVDVNTIYSTVIIAQVTCSNTSINRFTIITSLSGYSSLSNTITFNSSVYFTTLTWFPLNNYIGTVQLFCVIAIDSRNLQSNQYCLNFQVIARTTTTTDTSTSLPSTMPISSNIIRSSSSSMDFGLILGLILGLGIPLCLLLNLFMYCFCYPKLFRGRNQRCSKCQNGQYHLDESPQQPSPSTRPTSPFELSSVTSTTHSLMDPMISPMTPTDGSHLVRVYSRQIWPEKKQ